MMVDYFENYVEYLPKKMEGMKKYLEIITHEQKIK